MPPSEQDPHSRHFLMQRNVGPHSSKQLGALWQGKPALQMNLGGWAAEILPGKPTFWGRDWLADVLPEPEKIRAEAPGETRRRAKESVLTTHMGRALHLGCSVFFPRLSKMNL